MNRLNRINVLMALTLSLAVFSFGAVLSTAAEQHEVAKVEECGCLKDGECVCENCDCAKLQEDGSCDCSECQGKCDCAEGQNCPCEKRAEGGCAHEKKDGAQ